MNLDIPLRLIAEDLNISPQYFMSCFMEDENKHVGLFVPIPKKFHGQFHKGREKEDDSPPHITLLYIGDADSEDEETIHSIAKEVIENTKPFTAKFGDYSEFVSDEHRVAHVQIDSKELCNLHEKLKKAMRDGGIKVDSTYRIYKPHSTLNYVKPDSSYEGPVPTGEFEITKVGLWGFDKDKDIKLGKS